MKIRLEQIEEYIKRYETTAPGRTLSIFSADEQYELAKLARIAIRAERERERERERE